MSNDKITHTRTDTTVSYYYDDGNEISSIPEFVRRSFETALDEGDYQKQVAIAADLEATLGGFLSDRVRWLMDVKIRKDATDIRRVNVVVCLRWGMDGDRHFEIEDGLLLPEGATVMNVEIVLRHFMLIYNTGLHAFLEMQVPVDIEIQEPRL